MDDLAKLAGQHVAQAGGGAPEERPEALGHREVQPVLSAAAAARLRRGRWGHHGWVTGEPGR